MTQRSTTNPYTDDEVRDLRIHEAKADLLAEILAAERQALPPTRLTSRRRSAYRLALAGVAAAAVAAVGVSITLSSTSGAPTARPGSGGPGSAVPTTVTAERVELAALAARMPRFVLDEPGWQVRTIYGFGTPEGSLGFVRDSGSQAPSLQLEWYPAAAYDAYLQDRAYDPSINREPSRLLGERVTLFTYGPSEHATMLRPSGASFVEIRGSGLSRADYLEVTSRLREATVTEFVASMPDDVTTPGEQGTRAERVLADVPVPEGFRFSADGQTLDAYQFGALATGQVTCAWIGEYLDGDDADREQAADALATSHDWRVLDEMDTRGDWPDVVRQVADELVRGDVRPRSDYDDMLGCSRAGTD